MPQANNMLFENAMICFNCHCQHHFLSMHTLHIKWMREKGGILEKVRLTDYSTQTCQLYAHRYQGRILGKVKEFNIINSEKY